MDLVKRLFYSLRLRSRSTYLRVRYKIERVFRLRLFKYENWIDKNLLISRDNANVNWLFHDENWDLIVKRWEYRSALMNGDCVCLTDTPQPRSSEVNITHDGVIEVKGQTTTQDEWIFLYLDSNEYNWNNYSFKFNVEFETIFKEFQIDFRYADFFNRYRYRFQNGRLFFDIVYNGEFISSLSDFEFTLEKKKSYEIEIRVMGDIFQCWIDGVLFSTDFGWNKIDRGAVSIILWEDNGETDMNLKIHSISAVELGLE